ncbi:MAG: hypothetical protein U1A27_01805 [Phycisphaerae bacterium]
MIALPVLGEEALSAPERLLAGVLDRLAMRGVRSVALWGAGAHTRSCAGLIARRRPPLAGIIDDAAGGAGGELLGLPVWTRTEALARGIDAIVISSDQWEDAMWAQRGAFTERGVAVERLYPPGLARRMSLVIEIVGRCNARCTYCPTGNGAKPAGAIMPVELFERILDHLDGLSLIKSPILPYNFGEPLIHPRINDMLSAVRERGHQARISTNLIHLPRLSPESFAALALIEISLSGMTQASYAIGHGASLRQTLANIDRLLAMRDAAGATTPVRMRWHRYRFNEAELSDAAAFCDARAIEFMPYFAHLNDLSRVRGYFTGTLPETTRATMREHLFVGHMQHVVARFARTEPRDCVQFHDLTLDEEGFVLPCCAVPGNAPGARLGHVLDLDARQLHALKRGWEPCGDCLRRGWSGYVNGYVQPAELGLADEEFGALGWSDLRPESDEPFVELAKRLVALPPRSRVAVWGIDSFSRAHFGRFLETICRGHTWAGWIDETGSATESLFGLPVVAREAWQTLRPDLIIAGGHPMTCQRYVNEARTFAAGATLVRLHS